MINFLPADEKKNEGWIRLRHKIKMVTTVVLVVYVVGGAAWAGWWLFLVTRQDRVAVGIQDFEKQVVNLATEEVMVRQLASRSVMVVETLSGKRLAGVMAGMEKEGLEITGWKFGDGKSVIEVVASSAGELEVYALEMKKIYPQGIVNLASVKPDGRWILDLTLEGGEQ